MDVQIHDSSVQYVDDLSWINWNW